MSGRLPGRDRWALIKARAILADILVPRATRLPFHRRRRDGANGTRAFAPLRAPQTQRSLIPTPGAPAYRPIRAQTGPRTRPRARDFWRPAAGRVKI